MVSTVKFTGRDQKMSTDLVSTCLNCFNTREQVEDLKCSYCKTTGFHQSIKYIAELDQVWTDQEETKSALFKFNMDVYKAREPTLYFLFIFYLLSMLNDQTVSVGRMPKVY